ncbi:MAG TPA: serine hydrolase domain-containing protein [Terriglobia bacterium]|nr:serine hydrolase domain-containing protein [Terriglobia bacterium]
MAAWVTVALMGAAAARTAVAAMPRAGGQKTGAGAPEIAEVEKFYEEGLKRNGIVGSGLMLIGDGRVVGSDFQGFARLSPRQAVTENTTFHWASITKTLTAVAILQLRDHGLLNLDDPVVRYVPELAAVHDAWGPVDAITIRNLLTHSGGFRAATWPWGGDQDWEPFEPTQWSQIVAMLPYTEVLFKPGSRFSYSNLGFVFLGQIIERLSGDSYEVYVDKNVLKPLEMHQSYFDRSPYHLLKYRSGSYALSDGKLTERLFNFSSGITVSNSGLNAPLPDMVKYLKFLLGDAARNATYEGVLKRSSLEEMFQPELKIASSDSSNPNGPDDRDSVGLSCFVRENDGRKFIGHTGNQNGFISHMYLEPETRSAYVVNFNTDASDATQNTAVFDRDLRDYLFAHFFPPREERLRVGGR